MGATGSSAVLTVVPTVATAAQGRSPAARSSSTACSSRSGLSACSSSVAMRRRCAAPNPASNAPFCTELWAWSLAYTTSGARSACRPPPFCEKPDVHSRAQSSAVKVEVLAVSAITPLNESGRPTIVRSHSMTTSSTSVAAGLVCQFIACGPSPDETRSASTDERSVLLGKKLKNPGWFQCVMPGRTMRSRSAITSSISPPRSGGSCGSSAATSPGCDRLRTG